MTRSVLENKNKGEGKEEEIAEVRNSKRQRDY